MLKAFSASSDEEFGAVGEELRRSAFICFDMGDAAANDPVIGLAERSESQRIGGGSIEDEE